jgi:hypothetical protein
MSKEAVSSKHVFKKWYTNEGVRVVLIVFWEDGTTMPIGFKSRGRAEIFKRKAESKRQRNYMVDERLDLVRSSMTPATWSMRRDLITLQLTWAGQSSCNSECETGGSRHFGGLDSCRASADGASQAS